MSWYSIFRPATRYCSKTRAVTYYDVLREYQREFGEVEGRRRLNEDYTVISRPVDKRENYVKRCVGIPNDTIRIIDTELYVNGEKQIDLPGKQYIYFVQSSSPITQYAIDNLDITEWNGSGSYYYMTMTEEAAAKVKAMPNVTSVTRYNAQSPLPDIFPSAEGYEWTQDNFGPLWIPAKGSTVTLTTENLPLYRRIIEVYEGNTLEVAPDGTIYINDEPTDKYTFKMNYYWMWATTATIRPIRASGDSFRKTISSARHRSYGSRATRRPERVYAGIVCSKRSDRVMAHDAGDSYLTIASSSEAVYKEKSSKFLAYAYPVKSEEEIHGILDELHKRYYDATHHCYAWEARATRRKLSGQ